MGNSATVQGMYEAFGRGEVDAILSCMADDVRWDDWPHGNAAQQAGIDYMARRTGRDGVAAFFASLAALEFHSFAPTALLEGDGRVAALISVDVTVRATGTRFQDEEVHVWTFGSDGLVTDFRHHIDTAKHMAAARELTRA
jgi:ketosteroid isomerase-like protein